MPVLVWDGRNHPRYHPPAGSGDDRSHRRIRRSTGTDADVRFRAPGYGGDSGEAYQSE